MWNDVLTVLLVTLAISFILGVLLAIFIRFFGIEDDEKTKNIRAALPGVNCGACGFKGCDDYAKTLAEGGAKPNLCIPGGASTAEEIGAILGIEVEAVCSKVAFVHCAGDCENSLKKAEYSGVDSCRAKAALFGGPGVCTFGCLGCGDCAVACKSDAICIENGLARIDTRRCIGCGACVSACPRKIISMMPLEADVKVKCSNKDKGADARRACKAACIGCKKCEKICPSGAIAVSDNRAVIDYGKCTGCGACKAGCPTGAIDGKLKIES